LAAEIAAAVETAAAYAEAGADLAVIGLPLHATPDILEPLAAAMAPLA
jgi:prephenate dehydrogenase